MRGIGSDYAIVVVEKTIDDNGIGLGSSFKEKNFSRVNAAGIKDFAFGIGGKTVAAVARSMKHISIYECAQHIRMCADHIVAVEIYHDLCI